MQRVSEAHLISSLVSFSSPRSRCKVGSVGSNGLDVLLCLLPVAGALDDAREIADYNHTLAGRTMEEIGCQWWRCNLPGSENGKSKLANMMDVKIYHPSIHTTNAIAAPANCIVAALAILPSAK